MGCDPARVPVCERWRSSVLRNTVAFVTWVFVRIAGGGSRRESRNMRTARDRDIVLEGAGTQLRLRVGHEVVMIVPYADDLVIRFRALAVSYAARHRVRFVDTTNN